MKIYQLAHEQCGLLVGSIRPGRLDLVPYNHMRALAWDTCADAMRDARFFLAAGLIDCPPGQLSIVSRPEIPAEIPDDDEI